jgi:membrane-associated phospholipid phosphatase
LHFTRQRFAVLILLALAFLLAAHQASAQDSTQISPSLSHIFAEDVALALRDAGSYFSAPFHFSGREWLYTAGTAGGTVLLMSADKAVKDNVGSSTRGTLNHDFLDIPTRYGAVQYANLCAIATYATGLFVKNDDIRITGRLMFESLAFSGVTIIAMRYVAGRSRPYGNNGPWDFRWFETKNEVQSFPSGHATVAFAFSTVVAERIDSFWARLGFYGMASLTAYARVYNHQHWASDVVVGAGLGLLSGFHVVREEGRRTSERPAESDRLQLFPMPNGVRVTYRVN